MLKNKILEKLLAIILIFTLTSANFAFVTKTYASSLVETIFGEEFDIGHDNIGFEAYFGAEENEETSVISDVNNEDLAIGMKLNVLDSGYLKDAKIAIVEAEEGKGLNFKLKDQEEMDLLVQSIEDNVVSLQQINSTSEDIKFSLPIEYKYETYMNEENFSKDFLVVFYGIYVDNEGEEFEVSKEVKLNISWKDEREVRVESTVEKYIDFGPGIILQTLVKVDNTTEKNTLPVKESEVSITLPTISDVYPTNIYVVANSTLGTNGRNVGDVVFNEENWSYNQEENKLTIKANNEKQLVKVNEYEEEYLQDAEKEVIEEERFYNVSGVDEYLITYTYMDVNVEEAITAKSNIEAKLTTFSGDETAEYINIVTNSNDCEYLLEGKIGDIVSLNIENETLEVSKAYTYLNYNNNNRYEVEFTSGTMINVSYPEIVESLVVDDVENKYIDKEGNVYENNDLYYKQISLSKQNFDEMLGENGEIKVLDNNGNVITTINKDTEVNEEGNIVISFTEKYSKLSFETTKPIGEGNLVINNVKAMTNTTLEKSVFANLSSITTKSSLKAKYNYVEERVEVGTSEISTTLTDTKTKAILAMDRDSLSTLENNENVEIRIELNNAVDTSDVYGHSVFEIELPEAIEVFEVTNASLLYAEGLEITSVESVDRKIVITIDGKQDEINSGVLTNGTNIVLNANIKVNLYTPAKTELMRLTYNNAEATNYENGAVSEIAVHYSAPAGLVAINSLSNYNNVGTTTTSVRQGEKEDLIDIYAEAKISTMEIIVMNNNSNTVSNVSILGRIPFKGVKDIVTGEELGTTQNTKLVNGLVSDERNGAEFTIYYSENGEANKDLNDSANNWITNPESFENIKSYLIVPNDENYEMQEAEILRFTYQYEIPANLPHNEEFYGTFLAYYTNNSEIAVTDEESTPDKVGLTTGEGPELSLVVFGNKDAVKEQEELDVSVVTTNVGNNKVENVEMTFEIPNGTEYVSSESQNENIEIIEQDNIIKVQAPELQKDEALEVVVKLKVTGENVEEINEEVIGETIEEIPEEIIEELPEGAVVDSTEEVIEESITEQSNELILKPSASVTAQDLATVLKAESEEIKVVTSEFEVKQYNAFDISTEPDVYEVGEELSFRIYAYNLTENVMKNVEITEELPQELSFVKAAIMGYEEDGLTSKEIGEGTYNEETRVVSWNFDQMEASSNKYLMLTVKTNEIQDGTTIAKAITTVKIKAEGTDTYESNALTTRIGKPVLVVTQTTENPDTYIKEGDKINYIFTVRNEGKATAENVQVKENIPDGVIIEKINYAIDGVLATKRVNSNKEAIISGTLSAGKEMVINISALAANLDGTLEKTINNTATVSAENIEAFETNTITHIIEQSEKNAVVFDETVSTPNVTTSEPLKSNISKTYKISGTAWLDSNEDGMRNDGEQLLTGISVKLVNSESGVIAKSITTDSRGVYTFSGVENGNYLVIFDYDTVKYTVTAYRKDGVGDHVNSDAVTTQLEQEGKVRNGAISDVITVADGSISGIDIGFVLADKFDLKLENTITKLTTQTVNGTTTDTYENTKLAKTEIGAKYVSGSTVYIEYEISVTNVGDVAGYAKKIVDYLPEDMTFNSSLEANASWYTGTDGNIYSTELAEKELAPGETAKIKLVLTKQMTDENTGLVNNLAEIYEDYNIYGISDTNSTPANKAQGENDISAADAVILIKTGEVFINISVIITTILLGSIVVFIAYNKIVLSKRKGGV